MSKGYVYILTNESMPKLLKIGKTTRSPEGRAAQLATTGVPTPFKVAVSVFSPDCHDLESLVHERLAEFRVSPNREFFEIDFAEADIALVACHKTQVSSWLDEFLPDHEISNPMSAIGEADVHMMACLCGVAPHNVVAAFGLMSPSEFSPALRRWADKVNTRAAGGSS